MFLAGAAPNVSVVAPAPTCSASARAFAASRLITSTVCPALAARLQIAAGRLHEPIILMVLKCLSVSWVVILSKRYGALYLVDRLRPLGRDRQTLCSRVA